LAPDTASPMSSLRGRERALVHESAPPRGSSAMKALLHDEPFDDDAWIFERKLDGVRVIAVREGERVRLLSRNDLSFNARYPEVADALLAEPCERFAVDGEVVAFAGRETSFSRLAARGHHWVPVFYYVFDILWLDGMDLRMLPLRTRKRLLRATLKFHGPVRWTPHRRAHGTTLLPDACARGWEGLVAKREDSAYTATRSRDWLKLKCGHGQELVIGGFTEPKGSRTDFGALLLGYYKAGRLRYAGKVGTGFDRVELHELGRRLSSLRRDDPPFTGAASIRERGVTWVEPRLVAEVGFTEWTSDGRLRHPRFLGLRDDKAPTEVVRES